VFTEPLRSEERGIQFTEPLPKNDRETHIDIDRWEGFMKYAFEMGPSAMIHIQNFIKIGSGIQKLIRGIRRNSLL
jgi:hypothetical protein